MMRELRRRYGDYLASGAYLAIVLFGLENPAPQSRLMAAGLIAVLALWAWLEALHRYRFIADTPTSRIASAAQGYVELLGHARSHPGNRILSKLTLLPCVWFRYEIHRRQADGKWERLDYGESPDTFLLDDGSGECVVDPEEAEIVTPRKQEWRRGEYRYREWLILEQDPLYALGYFVTLDPLGGPPAAREEVGALLAEWKRDRAALLARFDANRDGEIDLVEWEAARKAAKAEVAERHKALQSAAGSIHVLRKPPDGRLYLLSNLPPEGLAGRFRRWAWFHLAVLLAAAPAAILFWLGLL